MERNAVTPTQDHETFPTSGCSAWFLFPVLNLIYRQHKQYFKGQFKIVVSLLFLYCGTLPRAEPSVMTILKKNMFVPGLTIRCTPILMNRSPSSTLYDDAVNDRSSGGRVTKRKRKKQFNRIEIKLELKGEQLQCHP